MTRSFLITGSSLSAWAGAALLAVPLVLTMPHEGSAQSFDCAKATKPNEHAVCEDANLGRIERSFAAAYLSRMGELKAYGREAERTRFRNQHRANIRAAEACGYDGTCIFNVYARALEAYRQLD